MPSFQKPIHSIETLSIWNKGRSWRHVFLGIWNNFEKVKNQLAKPPRNKKNTTRLLRTKTHPTTLLDAWLGWQLAAGWHHRSGCHGPSWRQVLDGYEKVRLGAQNRLVVRGLDGWMVGWLVGWLVGCGDGIYVATRTNNMSLRKFPLIGAGFLGILL